MIAVVSTAQCRTIPEGRVRALLRIGFADDDRIQTSDITADARWAVIELPPS